MNDELDKLLELHHVTFFYDPIECYWCLESDPKFYSLTWETDNFDADILEEAQQAAIDYLLEY